MQNQARFEKARESDRTYVIKSFEPVTKRSIIEVGIDLFIKAL
jgi:hypothetical protein